MIRTAKRSNYNCDDIRIEKLYKHFNSKLGSNNNCDRAVCQEPVRLVNN